MKFKEKHPYIYWELKGIAWIIGAIIFIFGALSIGDNNGFDIESDAFMVVVGIPTFLALFIGAAIMIFSPIVIFFKRLFGKKIKKNNLQKNNNKNTEEVYTKIIDSITNSNQEILSKFCECLENPMEYYKKNYSSFQERMINEYTTDDEIQFLAMIELLLENDYCCELDWKEYLDEFIYAIENLKNAKTFNKENLNEQDDISIWCDTINKEWEKQERCIAQIGTVSDSYVLFICSYEQLKYISNLTKESNCVIFKIESDEGK